MTGLLPEELGRTEVLSTISLFSAFTPGELKALAGLFVDVSYRRGDTVCAEGEAGDTFFVCLSGELEVWGASPKRVVNRLGPGDFFGEMSLLLGGKRAATVTVSRNAKLLALNKSTFERFFLHNAKVLEYFSRVLSKRLATMAQGAVLAKTTTTLAVTGSPGLKGKTLVASALAVLLRDFSGKEAALLTLEPRPAAGPTGTRPPSLLQLARAPTDAIKGHLADEGLDVPVLHATLSAQDAGDGGAEHLASVTASLGELFPWVVLDIGDGAGAIRAASEVSDILIDVVERPSPSPREGEGPHTRTFEVVNLHNPTSLTSPAIPISHCEPFVIREDRALRGLGSAAQVAHIRTQPRSPAAPALHRLARKILGTTVGIALGGGAAFGLAHIGVLKVLEDSGIPIDLTVGTSFGSIIALGYGVGVPTSEMVTLAKRVATRWNTLSVLSDLTLTKPAFMTGDRLVKIFMPLAGSVENFDQLAFPCRVVAGDIETGERVSIGSGSIEVAGRASCAVPMLWCPVKHEGRVLVDGGVVDPVPAEVVREMGADICIAVNAVPRLKRGVQTVLSRWYRRLKRLDPLSYLAGSRDLPNMFDIIMNSMQTLQYELGNFKAISADVRINPDLSALTWIEFYKPEQLMACGAEAAERAVPEIKRVLAERLETPRATEESVAALTA